MKRLVFLCAATLSGCASTPQVAPFVATGSPAVVERGCDGSLPAELSMQLDMIEKMLQGGRPRAALAHLQSVSGKSQDRPEVIYLSAEAYRRLGQEGFAAELYEQLLRGCLAGYAHRGLGLVQAQQGAIEGAVRHLRQAVAAEPVDADIRNDLGFALLEQGRVEAAAEQFATAVELRAGYQRAQQNLVLARLIQRRDREAVELARHFDLTAEIYADLEHEAARRLAARAAKEES